MSDTVPLEVTVYSKPDCRQCVATERALERRGVAFTHADALEPDNLAAIKSLGLSGAPVVIVRPAGAELGEEVFWASYRPDLITEHFGNLLVN